MGEATRVGFVVAAFVWGLYAAAPTMAQGRPFLIGKIADTNTPVPGGTGTYTSFGMPTSESFVADFVGGSGLYGIRTTWTAPFQPYTFSSVGLLDTTTAIPGGTGTFTSFGGLGLGDVFRGLGNGGQDGIYALNRTTGVVSLIADKNTPIPGGTGAFTAFGSGPQREIGDAITSFFGEGAGGQQGIYTKVRETDVSVVADKNTVAPDAGGAKFTSFARGVTSNTFLGTVNGHRGVYIGEGRNLRRVVDYQTPVWNIKGSPSPTGIISFSRSYYPFDNHAFRADFGATVDAVLKLSSFSTRDFPSLELVADQGTRAPGRDATFVDFLMTGHTDGTPEEGEETFFLASNSDDSVGIYGRTPFDGLARIIDTSMTLDGKQISGLSMGDEAVASYTVTFRADFADGSSGIYRAYTFAPEPGAAGIGLVMMFMVGRRSARATARVRARGSRTASPGRG